MDAGTREIWWAEDAANWWDENLSEGNENI